jgi:hypothetical protein
LTQVDNIEMTGERDFAPCACCGVSPRRVWGNLHHGGQTTAYVVQWSPGTAPDTHAAAFGLVFGPWDAGSGPAQRQAVTLEYRRNEGASQFMVRDAARFVIDCRPLADRLLSRNEVMDGPLKPLVFALIEQLWTVEPRLEELRNLQ